MMAFENEDLGFFFEVEERKERKKQDPRDGRWVIIVVSPLLLLLQVLRWCVCVCGTTYTTDTHCTWA